jgi:hypothetical protein
VFASAVGAQAAALCVGTPPRDVRTRPPLSLPCVNEGTAALATGAPAAAVQPSTPRKQAAAAAAGGCRVPAPGVPLLLRLFACGAPTADEAVAA